MISAQEFYVSPKYIALKAKVEDRLNAIPDYARAKAEMEDASNRRKEDGRQMKKNLMQPWLKPNSTKKKRKRK